MPVIQMIDDKAYGAALHLLHYNLGGTFYSRPERTLVVSVAQWTALQKAGLVTKNGSPGKTQRGKKTK